MAERQAWPIATHSQSEPLHLSSMAIWLGLDLGTQSLKAVLWQLVGGVTGSRVLSEASSAYVTSYPQPHWAEQAPRDWELATGRAIAAALTAAGLAPSDLTGIGVTGQLDGAIAVSDAGEPLSPALIWQDRRSDCNHLPISWQRVQQLTGQLVDPIHLAPKARWLQRHLDLTRARFHQPVSYLVERLTGRSVMDPALASTTLLFDLEGQRWSEELCQAWGINAHRLPEIAPSFALAGVLHGRGAAITGLPPGLAVCVGTGDDFTAALGAGIVAPGSVLCSLGTAEVVGALADHPVLDLGHRLGQGAPLVETHAYPTGHFFIENPGWMCGGVVTWLKRLLGIASDAEFDALAASAAPGSANLTFFPALAGAMTPAWRPEVRAAFTGLSSEHERGHLARAVLEGTAFACRDIVERLVVLGVAAESVRLTGGGSGSALWAQIRADVLQRPHQLCGPKDSAAIAAAMLAAVATGGIALTELADLAGPTRGIVTADPAMADCMSAAYQRYRSASAALVDAVTSDGPGRTLR
jgi:xylulokinase